MQHDGTSFTAYVNEKTGTPYWVIDVDSLDFTLGRTVTLSSETDVEAAARAFLTAHAGAFNISPKLLGAPRITTDGDLWFVSFPQRHAGVPVLHASAGLTVNHAGRIVALGIQAFPDIEVNTTPGLGAASAVQVARSNASRPTAEVAGEQNLVILPIERSDHYDFHLAWRVRLDDFSGDDPFSNSFLVEAHKGTVLKEMSNIITCSVHGHHIVPPGPSRSQHSLQEVEPDVQAPYAFLLEDGPHGGEELATPVASGSNSVYGYVKLNYYETPDDFNDPLIRHYNGPFKYARVRIERDSDGWTDETYANASGYYSFTGLSSGSHTVTFELETNKALIQSGLSTSERTESYTVNVSGATQRDYDWDWGDGGDGSIASYGVNTVYQIREIYDYFKNTYSFNGMDGVQTPLTIYSYDIGYTDYSTGTEIHIGGAEAMSSEVTYHEYSHDVIYRLYDDCWIQNNCDGDPDYTFAEGEAMNEGFADYFASAKAGDGIFGGPDGGSTDPEFPSGSGGVQVRWMNNSLTMNDWNVWGNHPHRRGQIIAGASWKVRQDIGSTADHLTFNALQISPQPASFIGMRRNMFAADDYYNNKTNWEEIEERFTERYIGGPLSAIVPYVTYDSNDFPVLHWTDRSVMEDGYRIERRYNSGNWSVIDDLAANTTQYTDNDYRCLGGGSGVYYYRIQGYYENPGNPDETSYSPTVSVDLETCDTGPFKAAPGGAVAETEVPQAPTLEAAYPNPFNPQTTIRYMLASDGPVRLAVYDVLGRETAVLVEGAQKAGRHEVVFDAEALPSGVYVYRLEIGGQHLSRTMLLAK